MTFRNEIIYRDGNYVYLNRKNVHEEGLYLGKKQIKFTIENPVKIVIETDEGEFVEEKLETQTYEGTKPFLVKITPSRNNEKEFLELIFSTSIANCIRFCSTQYHCKKVEFVDIGIWVLDLKFEGE